MNDIATISYVQPAYSPAAARALARKPQLFINNQWVDSTHGAVIEVEDPSNGKIVSHVVDASPADVDRAVAAARAAFDDGRWSGLPPMVRERTINRLADLLEAHANEFAELEAIDVSRHGRHRRDRAQLNEHIFVADVASMEDVIDAREQLEDAREKNAVGV